ncbi:transcriptional regulator [Escherichia coli]|nr:transcriptional regulator [Escherichia coli]
MEICMQEESNKVLIPGKVDERRFWLLIELSPFRSEKIVRALRDFLVMGYNRKEVCEKYGTSYSYFSIALKRLTHINDIVCQLAC